MAGLTPLKCPGSGCGPRPLTASLGLTAAYGCLRRDLGLNAAAPPDVAWSVTATRRWCLVAIGVSLLLSFPLGVLKLRPVKASTISAADLLAQTRASSAVSYSGYVQTLGTLALPLTDQFTDLADLFGQRTTMRVWWRGQTDWRVDQITTTGETDLFHDATGTTSWDFESNRATRTRPALIRLPQTSDLLPPTLAHTLLSGARPDDVTRLGAMRIAGISAPGFRLTPTDSRTSIGRVDIWVDPGTGLPLKVSAYGRSNRKPAITSAFASVSITRPSAAVTTFRLAPGARSRFEDVVDIAAAANQYAPVAAPPTLVGLSRSEVTGAVGVYGRGVSQVIAIPLQDRVAVPLRAQIEITPGSTQSATGDSLSVDPLNVLLTVNGAAGHSWLLAGTVTPATLAAAAGEISSDHLARNTLRPANLP
jgi:hypothetical protein